MKENIRPIKSQVYLKRIRRQTETTESGLEIQANERRHIIDTGEVLAIGDEAHDISVGDHVQYKRFRALEVATDMYLVDAEWVLVKEVK